MNFLFVVDLYNEGVDIPEIDTVLFLRPTESLTVFLQQLGRGLRLYEEKECLTVLDFVGQAHRNFRFDLRYRALLTDPSVPARRAGRARVHAPAGRLHDHDGAGRAPARAGEHPPDGCARLDRRWSANFASWPRHLVGLRRLSEFLERTGIEPGRPLPPWRRLVASAASRPGSANPFANRTRLRLTKGLRRIAHIDDSEIDPPPFGPARPGGHRRDRRTSLHTLDERRLLMLELGLWGRTSCRLRPAEGLHRLDANPTLRDELRELLAYRLGLHRSVAPRPGPAICLPADVACPIHPRRSLVALGHWTRSNQPEMREGVLHLPDIRADVFFVTLHKTEKDYSPTTMYQDYAINDRLFHWQSQSTTSADSPTGRRYVEHTERGYTVLLFGRSTRPVRSGPAYFFLGPCPVRRPQRQPADKHHLAAGIPAARHRLFRTLARLAVA